MDRLEDVVRGGESPSDLVFLLRGGVDAEEKLLRQAALLESRYTYGDLPARGISLFAASDDLDARTVLGTKLRTYPKYRQVSGAALGQVVVLLPTFQAPHWTALFQPASGVARPEAELLVDLLGTLGQYSTTRSTSRHERSGGDIVSTNAVVVDLEVDFHNEDETGYLWTWLSEARDPSIIAPDRIVVVGDDDALAMARIVDLIAHDHGTIVHVDVLPGTVDDYLQAAARATAAPF
jgi:hypothetical protein